jgi:curved DNA-binding protein CbpA
MGALSEEGARALVERGNRILSGDHFVALGVAHTASREDVHAAFVAAAKTWHPDRAPPGNAELKALFAQVFARLEVARTTLSDATARLVYVKDLRAAARPADASQTEASLEFKKAEVLLKKNDTKGAEAHLRRAVQLAPAVVEYEALLLWVQAKPGAPTPETVKETEKLILEYDRLVGQDPKCARALFYRGQLLKRVGRDADAKADFERTVQLDRSNIDAAREVRLYEMRQGSKPKAQTPRPSKPSEGEGVGGLFRRLFKK